MFDQLIGNDLLEPVEEEYLNMVPADYANAFKDVFRQFNIYTLLESQAKRIQRIYHCSVTVIGGDALAKELVIKLLEYGFIHINIIVTDREKGFDGFADIHSYVIYEATEINVIRLEDFTCIDANMLGDFTVVPQIGLNMELYRSINEKCVKNLKNLIPLYYDGEYGIIGPAVIPGKTACIECLDLKIYANRNESKIPEVFADKNSLPDDAVPVIQSDIQLIVNNFIIDFFKLTSRFQYAGTYNNIIAIDCHNQKILNSKVYKYVHCEVCSNLNRKLPYDIYAYMGLMTEKEPLPCDL
jgi:bacteriocin biosynthesis cyclodehydratase domain-containing protein